MIRLESMSHFNETTSPASTESRPPALLTTLTAVEPLAVDAEQGRRGFGGCPGRCSSRWQTPDRSGQWDVDSENVCGTAWRSYGLGQQRGCRLVMNGSSCEPIETIVDMCVSIGYNPAMSPRRLKLTDQIRQAVDESGMSRYRIAKTLGLSQATLSRFMAGKHGLVTDTLDRLADLLNLNITVKTTNRKQGKR